MSLMRSSLCFDRGLMGSNIGLKCGLQANSLNGVVHGGVTFLLGLMGSNFGLKGGLQASLMGLDAGPLDGFNLERRLPDGHLKVKNKESR